MAAQKGNLFLLKIYNGVTYDSILTARSTEMTINRETVDVSNKGSGGWRTLLAEAAPGSMSITLEGVFEDAAYEEDIRAKAQAGTSDLFELYSGNGDKWTGTFLVTSYSRAGNYNDAETYSITLESAGTVGFTAA